MKSSYERSVCTLIQLSYIEILFLVDEEEDKVNNNLLIKPKKDEREAEYAEPSDSKCFPYFDVDDLANRDDMAGDTTGLTGSQNNESPRIEGTSPLSMSTQTVENFAENGSPTNSSSKVEAQATLSSESKFGGTSVGFKNRNTTTTGGGGSFESLASSTKSEDSSDNSAAAANSTVVVTLKKDPTFPKSAAVPPPLLRTSRLPRRRRRRRPINHSCYNAFRPHTKCQPCRENDGSDQIQIPCKKCPRFKLITCGFAGSGKFCVALVRFF